MQQKEKEKNKNSYEYEIKFYTTYFLGIIYLKI